MSQGVMSLLQKSFSNRIRMTLKTLMIPLYLRFSVAFHVYNKFCVENKHILANKRHKIRNKGWLIFSSKFVTFLRVTREEGVQGE